MEALLRAIKAAFPESDMAVVTPQSQLGMLPGWDSMNAVNLLIEMQSEFGIDLEGIPLDASLTIHRLLEMVQERISRP